jgi:hypothetical protein
MRKKIAVILLSFAICLVWGTSISCARQVTFVLNDQYGNEIPGSAFYHESFGTIPTGTSVDITDGTYPIEVLPGIGGINDWGLLRRTDDVEIDESFTGQFEWITRTEQIWVRDQNAVPIPGSAVAVHYVNLVIDNGSEGTFPITDEIIYPTIAGSWKDGIGFMVRPGIGGMNIWNLLHRNDAVEIDESFTGEFEWITVEGPLYVVDESGIEEVEGSSYYCDMLGNYQSGDAITLPVTDNDLYPGIGGNYSDGYDIIIYPGDQPGVSALYSYEFYADYSILPQFVNINDSLYGLRFMANNAPLVDAGPCLSILSEEQDTTVVIGSASDQDEDPLVYLWKEGETVLLDPTSVLPDGTAPLDLSTLPTLSIGEHTFTLEVTDGMATVSANTIVTVNNSPPTVVASGGGTYEVGTDITLSGQVADYDGDDLTYEWKQGDDVLFDGTVSTVAGGAPVELPEHNISGLQIGSYELTLEVTDGYSTPVATTVTVHITDGTAPTLSPVAVPAILWPPNHKMVDVTIYTNASDNSGGPVTLNADIYSSEPPETDGDGNTVPDYTDPLIDQATGEITLQLRSERSGKGDGRTYTVLITATDESGNSSCAEVKILAPHDKSRLSY